MQRPEWYDGPDERRAAEDEQEYRRRVEQRSTPGDLEQLEKSARIVLEKVRRGEIVKQYELAYIARYIDRSQDRIQELESQIEEIYRGIQAQ